MAKLTKLTNGSNKQDVLIGSSNIKINSAAVNTLNIGTNKINAAVTTTVHSDQETLTNGAWKIIAGQTYSSSLGKFDIRGVDSFGNSIVAIGGRTDGTTYYMDIYTSNEVYITYDGTSTLTSLYKILGGALSCDVSEYYVVFDNNTDDTNIMSAIKSVFVKYAFDIMVADNLNITNSNIRNLTVGNKIKSQLVPSEDNKFNLGSSTKGWKNAYINKLYTIAKDVDSNGNPIYVRPLRTDVSLDPNIELSVVEENSNTARTVFEAIDGFNGCFSTKLLANGSEIIKAYEQGLRIKNPVTDRPIIDASNEARGGINIGNANLDFVHPEKINIIPGYSGWVDSGVNPSEYDRIKIGGNEYISEDDKTDYITTPIIFAYKKANSNDDVVPFAITKDGTVYYKGKEILNSDSGFTKAIVSNGDYGHSLLDMDGSNVDIEIKEDNAYPNTLKFNLNIETGLTISNDTYNHDNDTEIQLGSSGIVITNSQDQGDYINSATITDSNIIINNVSATNIIPKSATLNIGDATKPVNINASTFKINGKDVVTLTDGLIPAAYLPGFVDEIFKINSPVICDGTLESSDATDSIYLTTNYYVVRIASEDATSILIKLAKWNGKSFDIISNDISDTILIDINTNIQYRAIHESGSHDITTWDDSVDTFSAHFAAISGGGSSSGGSGLVLGETSSTAYAGDKGKANADAIVSLQTSLSTLESTVSSNTSKFNNYLPLSGGTVNGYINIGTYALRSSTSSSSNLISQSSYSTKVGRTTSSYYTLLQSGSNVRSKMLVSGSSKDLAVLDDLTLQQYQTDYIIDNVYNNAGMSSSLQLFNTLQNLVSGIKNQHYTKQEIDDMGVSASDSSSNSYIKDVALLPNGNESVDFNPMNAPVNSTGYALRVMPNCDCETINSVIKSVCSYIPSDTHNYLYENGYYEISQYCYVILANETSYVIAKYIPSLSTSNGYGDRYQIAIYQKNVYDTTNIIYDYTDLNGVVTNMQYSTSETYDATNILNTINVGDKNDIFGKIFTPMYFRTINDMPQHYQIYKTNPVQPVAIDTKHKVTSLTFNTNLSYTDVVGLFDQLTFTETGYSDSTVSDYTVHIIYDDNENSVYIAKYYSIVTGHNIYELRYEKKVQYYNDSSMSSVYTEIKTLPLFSCEYNDDRTTINGSWCNDTIISILGYAETKYDIRYGSVPVLIAFAKNIISFKNGYLTFNMNGGVSKTSTEFIYDNTIIASSVSVGTQNTLLQNIIHEGVVGQAGGYFMMVDNEWKEVNLFGSSTSTDSGNSGSTDTGNDSTTEIDSDPITASYYGYDTIDDSITEGYFGEDDE